jgi:hypothetical protein
MPHRKNGCNGEVRRPAAAAPLHILLRAAPGSQILDLVGPFQVFTRASEILARSRLGTRPVYSLEVVTTEPGMLLTSCGLRLEAARRRLQESNAGLESVAATCGFRNCDAMRKTFKRVLRVAPGAYRWRFQATQW